MSRGAKVSLFFGVFAVAIVVSAGSRIASARASGPPQAQDLAAGITAYANSEVNAATAESTAIFSEFDQAEVPAPAPAPSAPPSQVDVAPQPSSPGADAPTTVSAGAVEITAALPPPAPSVPALDVIVSTPTEAATPFGEAGPSARSGEASRHDLERLGPRVQSAGHARRKIVIRSTSSLRVDLRTRTTATGVTSSSSARVVARSTVSSTVKNSTSGGSSQRPTAPRAPLPFPPFPPNAPAPPNSGASSTGGGGGQGALLTFSVVLAALVILGIHRLLRRVHWSGLRMPGRGAALPWKPG